MKIHGKRILRNGAVAGYVLQKNGSYKWRIVEGPKKNYQKAFKNFKSYKKTKLTFRKKDKSFQKILKKNMKSLNRLLLN